MSDQRSIEQRAVSRLCAEGKHEWCMNRSAEESHCGCECHRTSKNRLELLEKCAALLWDAQDMMNDGPDDSDVAYAHGKLKEAIEVARELHRQPSETSA